MKAHDIYLGTQTTKGSKGIYRMRISADGRLQGELELLAEQPSPTYFYLTRDRQHLFAVSEPIEGEKGAICVYKIDPETKALSLHSQREAAGSGLCHITMDEKSAMRW